MCGETDRSADLGLSAPVRTNVCLIDTTFLEANIHFLVDWVLVKGVTSTLLNEIKLIRRAGLRERMPQEPEAFATDLNRMCIAMTHTRRKTDSREARKQVLRAMNPLLRTIAGRARPASDLLAAQGAPTN